MEVKRKLKSKGPQMFVEVNKKQVFSSVEPEKDVEEKKENKKNKR